MRSCQSCRAVVPDGAAFCPACGTRLTLAKHAVPMRTERKIVTVLFADIKSSIDLVAAHDPEQAGDVLAEVVSEMGDAVRAQGGVVNQILGDGIMALFGAPLALEEHAALACRAALAMRAGVRALHPELRLRIGLGSGEVVVRALSGDMTVHYGAAGEAVHFASRLEQGAKPDQILLTPATLALTGGLASVRSLGQMAIKGLVAPMEVYELLGMAERRARPARGGSRLVGRDRELAFLQRALERAAAGRASGVRVIAEAGCGKSRLVGEFTMLRLPEGWGRSIAEAQPHRRTSYDVVVALLRDVFALQPGDDAQVRREKLLEGMALPAAAADEQILPGVAPLLGLSPPAGWGALAPRERRERTIAASSRALRQASHRRAIALVVEDAHWLDPESAEAVQLLGAGEGGRGLLSITTERPPETAFTDATGWAECHLSTLDADGAHALLGGMLEPGGPEVARFERLLLARTQGNPLFIEECLAALADLGELTRVGARYRLERPVEELRVPASLRALLDARVDRLQSVEKDVLQAASVVGTTVRADLLRRIAELAPEAVDDVLDRLCRAGFLVEAGRAGDAAAAPRRFAFRHGLIRDAAYNGILLKTRIRMHASVLAALEERGGDEAPDLLADHASRAESWGKAVRYARLAAQLALDRYANPEALRYYRQALAAAEQWPEGAEKEKAQLGLHIGVRWPLFRLGQVRDLLPHLERAAALAAREGDHVQLGQCHALRSHGHWLAGQPALAEQAAVAAVALGRETGDRDLAARGMFQCALVHLTRARLAELVTAMEAVVAHLGDEPPRSGPYGLDADLAVTALSYIARAHSSAGNTGAAQAAIERAVAQARRFDRKEAWIYLHTAHGTALLSAGRPHAAVVPLEAAYAACTETDIRLLIPVVAGFLALACIEAGRLERGLALAHGAVQDAERMGFLALQPLRLAILAEARLLAGELDAAELTAAAAAALAAEIEEPGAEAFAAGLRGEIALRRGEPGEARRLFGAGLAQAEALGLKPLAATIRQRLERPECRAHPWLDGLPPAP